MRKTLKIIILLIIYISIQTTIFASTLNLNITSDKDVLKVGDKVKIKVSWDKGMQAADFSLKYDSKVLEFVKCDLKDVYVNHKNDEVKIAWFSDNNKDKTEIEYVFKAIENGKATFNTKINGGFATGELEIPNEYNNSELTISVEGNSNSSFKILILIIVIILVILKMIKNAKKRNKRK